MAVVCPGDEVLIPAPYWTSYPDMVKMCQANPVIVSTTAVENYVLTAKSLQSALESNPKISCLILCNPSNPTGSLMTAAQLAELVGVLEAYPSVSILSDEIYDRLVYDGMKHSSIASYPSLYERTITINGFSKSYAMTGYRLGYSASSIAIAKACSKIQSQITSCASSISQAAGYAALSEVEESWFQDRLQELQRKRDLAYSLLQGIPNISCPKPQGAFYLLPDVSAYFHSKTSTDESISNSHELCLQLLKQEQVAVVSGDAFGAPSCLRLSYATSEDVIIESITRMKKFLLSLRK
jgi:aspartate/methionine/tyrosine aminotransferase